jgi:hypothetical protein
MNPSQHLKIMVRTVMSEIKQKLEDFCKDREDDALTSEMAAAVSKGLQDATLSAARQGYRTFIESYDIDVPTIQMHGTTYRRKLSSPKPVMSPFGLMKVTRHLYQADRGGKSHAPLDAMWDMEGEYATPEVREAALYTLSHVTSSETAKILKKIAPFHPSATAIQAMAERIGQEIEAHEAELSTAIRQDEEVPADTKSMVVSMDGVNVLLREPGPRKGRPKERPDSPSKEKEPTSYRNAMVGSISFYGEVPPEEKTPVRLKSLYVSHMPEERGITFKQRFEEEVKEVEKKAESEVIRVILCDGSRSLWKYIDSNPLYEGYEKLVDFYHTSEHLSKAAEALFGKGSPEATRWYENWYEKLKTEEGAAWALLRSIDYHRDTRKLSKSRLEDLRKERTYFKRNKKRMKYAEFRMRGLPIGSGPVEAACKTIVKTRMCRSGMRWSREGGQHILHLRTYNKSGRWDSFWFHCGRLRRVV